MTRCVTLNDENGYDWGSRRRTLQPYPWSGVVASLAGR